MLQHEEEEGEEHKALKPDTDLELLTQVLDNVASHVHDFEYTDHLRQSDHAVKLPNA